MVGGRAGGKVDPVDEYQEDLCAESSDQSSTLLVVVSHYPQGIAQAGSPAPACALLEGHLTQITIPFEQQHMTEEPLFLPYGEFVGG